MNNIHTWANTVAIVLLVGVMLVGGYQSAPPLSGAGCNGGNCTDFDAVNTSEGYYVDDTVILNASGSALTLVSSNSASSTAKATCFASFATSTQTPIKFVFGTAFGTTTLPGGTVSNGLVAWQYGTCP
jgi:hypothetical protein